MNHDNFLVVVGGPKRFPSETNLDNARLIAAAPALMEVLQETVTFLAEAHIEETDADHYGDDSCSYCDAIAAARAAIAQATNNDDVESLLTEQGEARRQLGREIMEEQS